MSFEDADRELIDTLDNLDGADQYARWIYTLVRASPGKGRAGGGGGPRHVHRVCSATRGGSSRAIRRSGARGCCASASTADPTVKVLNTDLHGAIDDGPYDSVVMINVLEHVEDDVAALHDAWKALRPGGRLILWVPAMEWLYSDLDRRIGHHRRYHLKQLRRLLGRDRVRRGGASLRQRGRRHRMVGDGQAAQAPADLCRRRCSCSIGSSSRAAPGGRADPPALGAVDLRRSRQARVTAVRPE